MEEGLDIRGCGCLCCCCAGRRIEIDKVSVKGPVHNLEGGGCFEENNTAYYRV